MNIRRRLALAITLALALALASWVLTAAPLAAAAAATTAELAETPVVGQPAMIRVLDGEGRPLAGVAVTAKYRVNAHESIQTSQSVGTTGSDGRLQWTPEQAGVVVLDWEGGSHAVSVVYDGLPASGIVVAMLAAILLLGGSAFFFGMMLREDRAALREPPST